ncbi:MAG: phosphodiester glycosidase family protein [Candidatus Kapaibacteriales bacterium]
MKNRFNYFLIILLAISLIFADYAYPLHKSGKPKPKTIKQSNIRKIPSKQLKKKASLQNQHKPKTKRSKRTRDKIISRKVNLNYVEILKTQNLANGIKYKKLRFGKSNPFIIAHLVEVDIEEDSNLIAILKSKNTIEELDYPKNIFEDFQFELTRIYKGQIFALINANFWMAYLNYPIGILIADGEVLSMKRYKNWSSAFFDKHNRMYIDNFTLEGEIYLNNGTKLSIDNVNYRKNEERIVLYNKYYGQTLPKIKSDEIDKILEKALAGFQEEWTTNDSTEVVFDTTELRNQLLYAKQSQSLEFSTIKISLEWLDPPQVNRMQKVRITSLDTSSVSIPGNGYVISFLPESFPKSSIKLGDTVGIFFKTNKLRYIPFYNAVSGTPRLVRKGKAKPEAYEEGSRGRRFISGQLARTAIGTNLAKTKIYFVVVETPNSINKNVGASLMQLALIMRNIGSYDAINLDGGGSSVLLVNGERVSNPFSGNGRQISVGIGIIRKGKHNLLD